MLKQEAVVFDLDGVLVDSAERLHRFLCQDAPLDWDAWYRSLAEEPPPPREEYVQLLKMLSRSARAVLITGRPEWVRQDTYKWVQQHVPVPTGLLLMWDGQQCSWNDCKMHMLDRVQRDYRVVLAVDDSKHWCDMYCDRGIPAIYVNNGLLTAVPVDNSIV